MAIPTTKRAIRRAGGSNLEIVSCSSKHQAWHAVSARLIEDGFARFDASLFSDEDQDAQDLRASFVASCCDLPADRHSNVEGTTNRRFGRFVLDSASELFEAVPPVWDRVRREYVTYYEQQGCFNPEHAGKRRAFSPLTNAQYSSPFLRSLIRRCFSAVPWSGSGPVLVGVHIVEFRPRPGHRAEASPSKIHCDGEPFTWAFLINRRNVMGAENIIASPDACGKNPNELLDGQIRAHFTLERPLDGWVIDDGKVSHYVSPASVVAGADFGQRTILMIDFVTEA